MSVRRPPPEYMLPLRTVLDSRGVLEVLSYVETERPRPRPEVDLSPYHDDRLPIGTSKDSEGRYVLPDPSVSELGVCDVKEWLSERRRRRTPKTEKVFADGGLGMALQTTAKFLAMVHIWIARFLGRPEKLERFLDARLSERPGDPSW